MTLLHQLLFAGVGPFPLLPGERLPRGGPRSWRVPCAGSRIYLTAGNSSDLALGILTQFYNSTVVGLLSVSCPRNVLKRDNPVVLARRDSVPGLRRPRALLLAPGSGGGAAEPS